MPIDSFTVLFFGLALRLVLGGLFFAFWVKDRQSIWFAWWGATLGLSSITSILFMVTGAAQTYLTVGVGAAALIAGVACCWQGARAFHRRPPVWGVVLGTPALWLGLCLLPTIVETTAYRVVLSSAIIAPLFAFSGWEFWRGRREQLPSRWAIIVIFASLSLIFASRIPLLDVVPFPFGALTMQPGWLGAFNLILLSHTLLLVVLFVAISKERLELEQRTKAQTDPLTGALNRRALTVRGERILARHQHDRAALCLLYLDLDHFKSLNDRFGHSGGDDVLMSFVSIVHQNIRPTDFLFRIGGEEFCCMLPYTDMEQAHQVAERIRFQFEMTRLDVGGMPVTTTVSLGIASTETFGYDLDVLMRRADMAVYAAKRQGRNQVVIASAEEAPALTVVTPAPGAGMAAAN